MRIAAVSPALSPANERQPFIVVIRSIVVFLAERRSAPELAQGDARTDRHRPSGSGMRSNGDVSER
jgi:hypothetical protein